MRREQICYVLRALAAATMSVLLEMEIVFVIVISLPFGRQFDDVLRIVLRRPWEACRGLPT